MKNVHVQRKIRILTSTIQSGGEILESFFFLLSDCYVLSDFTCYKMINCT